MKRTPFISLVLVLVMLGLCDAQQPKHEFRGAWIATVVNLDWPYSINPSNQKLELTTLFDELKQIGINAVVFQIRPECDALYDSPYEPWSYWLTNTQGTAPNPYYDPLEFAVEEAHKRGLELHAWFNPYRAERSVGSYSLSAEHVVNQHPDWILTIGSINVLDPGLPMVRDFVTSVILDVVHRYDVDGIHFDDYFYPYPPNQITNQDAATFAAYDRGFTNLGNWRRDNVNLLVEMVYDSIQIVKPHVKFGISPFGIWRNGVPSGIVGMDAYNVIYGDALAWLLNQTVDYIAPQLYWPFGGGQDYGLLLPWWADQLVGRHLYPGMAAYRLNPSHNWPANELVNQINLNRQNESVDGQIFFRANSGLTDNAKGFSDSLKNNYFRYPALVPSLEWKDSVVPNAPLNLRYESLAGGENRILQWDIPTSAADGDSASRYAVYRKPNAALLSEDITGPEYLYDIISQRSVEPSLPVQTAESYYYAVSALDRNFNESILGTNLEIISPPPTQLVYPIDGAIYQADTISLKWNESGQIAFYRLDLALGVDFNPVLISYDIPADTVKFVSGVSGPEQLFWRVRGSNAAGEGDWSDIRVFGRNASSLAYEEMVPFTNDLSQNYPNPFNPVTKIRYSIAAPGRVSLKIYDILGRKIHELVNTQQAPGSYTVIFDARNLPSGVYIYDLQTQKYSRSRKMIVLK